MRTFAKVKEFAALIANVRAHPDREEQVRFDRTSYSSVARGPERELHAFDGHFWLVTDREEHPLALYVANRYRASPICASPALQYSPGPVRAQSCAAMAANRYPQIRGACARMDVIDEADAPRTAQPADGYDCIPALLARFKSDRDCLERLLPPLASPRRTERLLRFYAEWRTRLDSRPFEPLSRSDRVDWLLFRSLLDTEQRRLHRAADRFATATEALFPIALDLIALEQRRHALQNVEPSVVAQELHAACSRLAELRSALPALSGAVSPTLCFQAAQIVTQIKTMLEGWFAFYYSYDPMFDWWVEQPYRALDAEMDEYARLLREQAGETPNGEAIIGEPIGREALIEELRHAQVPYEPEELIAAGKEEMEWCRSELRKAAGEIGCGDDWRAALDRVKSDHVDPGAQPALVRDLAYEAIAYVEDNELVTVPPLARECWRMEMMSADRQKVNPFFLGGEEIIVSYPTADMAHAQKRMSLRGNNRAFARATVHHELIPGHHLQFFALERYRSYRRVFWTPFWIEGWTLHWEMLLWERNFARTPEERIGMLFWRLHRGARVLFSLEFHMGRMTAADCVELLVHEAGHERDQALAEVRRSFGGDYEPLYQAAYLVGAWQMHALYRELVGSGKLTDREFHDAVLAENCIPIPTLRALLTGQPLPSDFAPLWRFYPLPYPDGSRRSS